MATLPGSASTNLVAVSPIGEAPVANPSNATFQTAPNVPQVVGVMDTSRAFGWTAVSPGWFETPGAELGPLSTAVQLVFMVPGIFTADLSQQSRTVSALESLAEVQAFADALQSNAGASSPLTVPAVASAYQTAVSAGLKAASALPAPVSHPPAINLKIGTAIGTPGSRALAKNSRTLADTSTASYSGPYPLNDADALFAVTNASATGITVVPEWSPTSGITTGLLQGLYWFGGIYQVDTTRYSSFADLKQVWEQDPWHTDIKLKPQPPIPVILAPQINYFKLLDPVKLITTMASVFLYSASANANGTLLQPDGVYVLHLYTCGFAQSNPNNFAPDNHLIAGWDTPAAQTMRAASCVFNVAMAGLDFFDGVLGEKDLLLAFGGEHTACSAQFSDALDSILVSVGKNADPLFGLAQPPSLSGSLLALGDVTLDGTKALIPAGVCKLNWLLVNGSLDWFQEIRVKAQLAQLKFLRGALAILQGISDVGNLVNIVGSAVKVEPWQGEYIEVGDPWAHPPPPGAAWSMFHHDIRHTGLSPFSTAADTGTQKWKFATGLAVFSSPAVGADGTIYVGSDDGNLYAINPDGTEKWAFPTGDYVESSPAIGSDGTIYVGCDDYNLYAINPDGTQKWKFATGGSFALLSSPAIGSDGTIYVGTYAPLFGGNLYAVNADGTQEWAFPTGAAVWSSPAIGADGTIYVSSDYLHAVNRDGSQKWEFGPPAEGGSSSPAIASDGTIYVGSEDRNLYAVNPDGTQKWKFATRDRVTSSPAIGSDGTIYVGSWDRNLYAVNPDGTQKWKFATGDLVDSSPAIGSDGTIYVGSLDGNLYAINPDGSQKWNFATGDAVRSSPAIGSDGTIYVGTDDGNLYAIH